MRCRACNVLLEDVALKRKDSTGEFLDLCNTCYGESTRALADYVFDVDSNEEPLEVLLNINLT